MAGTAGTPGTPGVLRAMNDRTALDLLLAHGPLSRTRIGKLTGLSKPTASQLLARLEAAGLVLATGTTEGRPGPNAQLYEVNPSVAHAATPLLSNEHRRDMRRTTVNESGPETSAYEWMGLGEAA